MNNIRHNFVNVLLLSLLWAMLFCHVARAGEIIIRLGFFPNVTHAHALLLQNFAREGNTEFSPSGFRLEWKAFNAGPSAMEAIYAGAVDMTYVGPSPVLNAYLRARGHGVRVISGGTRGGAGLVVHGGSGLQVPEDFRGKRIATPQLGNTQDIACRNWLLDGGLKVSLGGGDVRVVPTANPDQLPLFLSGNVDGVWTVEPWLSRLIEAGGELIYAEPMESSIVTVLAVQEGFLQKNSALVLEVLKLHDAINTWMLAHPEEACRRVADELSRITRREFPLSLVKAAWSTMAFSTHVSAGDFETSFAAAVRAGFLKEESDSRELLKKITAFTGE